MTFEAGKCDVCSKGAPVGVAASTCGAISFAYCRSCLEQGAEPYWAIRGYVAMAGARGPDSLRSGYLPIIEASCRVAGKTVEEFWKEVGEQIDEFEKEEAGGRQEEDQEAT